VGIPPEFTNRGRYVQKIAMFNRALMGPNYCV
jgi:hypothetical protein